MLLSANTREATGAARCNNLEICLAAIAERYVPQAPSSHMSKDRL